MGLLSVGSLAGGVLPGCASIDRWVLGEESEDPQKVLVIGGGLAGLHSAYLLKKSQIPFLLVEGSGRLGGRVYSLPDFNSAAQVAELGGEWILPQHETTLQLCKDLRLELTERNWGSKDFALVRDGKIQERKKIENEFKKALVQLRQKQADIFGRTALRLTAFNADQLTLARSLDQQTAMDYLRTWQFSSDIQLLLQQSLEVQWGVSAHKLSALSVFQLLGGIGAHFPGTEKAYRVSSGASSLSGALADRITGVIPGHRVQLNSALIEIDINKDFYELKFQTPSGVKVLSAKTVICTLPLAILKQIRGFYKLSFPDKVSLAIQKIQYGSVSKGAFGFSERPWMKNQGITRWWSPGSGLVFMESEPRVDRPALTPKSVLSFQLGGETGAYGGLQTLDLAANDLSWLKLTSNSQDSSQIFNWGTSRWSQGGTSFWGPGQASECAGLLTPSGISWVLAGEHTSLLFQGTMNGALESAVDAVRQVQQMRSKNSNLGG